MSRAEWRGRLTFAVATAAVAVGLGTLPGEPARDARPAAGARSAAATIAGERAQAPAGGRPTFEVGPQLLERLRALEAEAPSGAWDFAGGTLAVERGGLIEVYDLAEAERNGADAPLPGPTPGAPAVVSPASASGFEGGESPPSSSPRRAPRLRTPRPPGSAARNQVAPRSASRAATRILGWRPRLAPDGHWLAVERSPAARGSSGSAVVVVDLTLGRELSLPGAGTGEDVRWSPDGRRLAAVLTLGPVANVYVFDRTEASLYQLTETGGGAPRWIGDGKLLYEAPRAEGGFGLFLRGSEGLGPPSLFWDEAPPAAPVSAGPASIL